jgi:obg-like ATPase 1
VTHVDGEVNPVRDLETISDELRLKDIQYLTPVVDKLERALSRSATDKQAKFELVCDNNVYFSYFLNYFVSITVLFVQETLTKVKQLLDEGKHVRFSKWGEHEVCIIVSDWMFDIWNNLKFMRLLRHVN